MLVHKHHRLASDQVQVRSGLVERPLPHMSVTVPRAQLDAAPGRAVVVGRAPQKRRRGTPTDSVTRDCERDAARAAVYDRE